MQRYELPPHTFALRALPQSSEVLVNIEHRAVRSIDCTSGETQWEISFPDGVGAYFSILQWYIAPNGTWSFALDENDLEYGIRFDHVNKTSRRITLPVGIGIPSGTCWFDPAVESELQFVTFDGLTWSLEGANVVVGPAAPSLLAWGRRVSEAVPGYPRFNQIRTDFGDGRAYFLSQDIERVGRVTIPGADVLEAEGTPEVTDLAEAAGALFVATERCILRHRDGDTSVFFEPAQNERIHGIATVGHTEHPLLAVLLRLSGGSYSLLVQRAT